MSLKRHQIYADPMFQEYRSRFLAIRNMVEMDNRLLTGVDFIRPASRAQEEKIWAASTARA